MGPVPPCPARTRALLATAILALAGMSGCSSLTHQSEWLGDAQGHLGGREFHYALPRSLFTVKAANASTGMTITEPAEVRVADVHARYAVRLDPSVIAHDKYNLVVANGLLSSAKSENVDKSSEIAKTLVQIAAEGLKLSVTRSETAGKAPAARARWAEEVVVLDPFGGGATAGCGRSGRSSVTGCLSGLQVSATEIDGSPLPVYRREQLEAVARQCESSLCSRLLRPVRIAVRLGGIIASDFVKMVPDPGLVVGHDVRRGACIQRITTLTFSNGVLTDYQLDKESEVLGCLKIPLEVMKEIAKIPGSLLTFRIEQVDNENKLLESQKKQLDAIMALASAQAEFARSAQSAQAAQPRQAAAPGVRSEQLDKLVAEESSLKASIVQLQEEAARAHCAQPGSAGTCLKDYQACRKSRNHEECLR